MTSGSASMNLLSSKDLPFGIRKPPFVIYDHLRFSIQKPPFNIADFLAHHPTAYLARHPADPTMMMPCIAADKTRIWPPKNWIWYDTHIIEISVLTNRFMTKIYTSFITRAHHSSFIIRAHHSFITRAHYSSFIIRAHHPFIIAHHSFIIRAHHSSSFIIRAHHNSSWFITAHHSLSWIITAHHSSLFIKQLVVVV